jgi:parallel beta-helix repeat protein
VIVSRRASALAAILCYAGMLNVGCGAFPSTVGEPLKSSSASTLTIAGKISPILNGVGAIVTLKGPAQATTTTDSAGNYNFKGLPAGSYTVTPSKAAYIFNPASQRTIATAANVMDVNFVASQTGSYDPVPSSVTITGTISPVANGGGATVTLNGAALATTTTDNAGNYTFRGFPTGTYTITPNKAGFNFSPASRRMTASAENVSGVNFAVSRTGSPNPGPPTTFTIAGTVGSSANGAGATVSLSGSSSATTTANSDGNYTFSGLAGGSYTVTPSKAGFTFSPASQKTTVSAASVNGVNFAMSRAASTDSGVTVNIYPGTDIANVVDSSPSGTTFLIYPGTYRLSQPINPKNGDSFIGQTACAPPASSCPVIISGSRVISSLATFDGSNYRVTEQSQHGPRGGSGICDSGWPGCIYPEDLFFDGVPYQHLGGNSKPVIGSGQWWFDYPNRVIYFHDNPSGHNVETSLVNNAFGGGANNVTIQYLTIQEFATMYPTGAIGTYQDSNPLTQGANWTIQNCEIKLNHGFGVRVGYGIQVLNSYIHDNGQLGVGGGIGRNSEPSTESVNSGVLIQGNVINHNDYAHFNPGFGSGGFKVGSTSGVTLRGNTIQRNEGAGIHFDVFSQNELVDGNTITDNTDADGLEQEIGSGTSIFRNNLVLRNGAQVNDSNYTYQIAVRSSTGVQAYCNVMEVSSGTGINGWGVLASNRGYSSYPPYQYMATSGNSIHHNTVLWDAGAYGTVGFFQSNGNQQSDFFAQNSAPDFNTYHLSNTYAQDFTYDVNNPLGNAIQTFGNYQTNGADVHGGVDSNYSNGYPTVSIASPIDQSSVSSPATIAISASDPSGISKVELYLDWVLQATSTASPYSFTWTNGTAGSHTVTAMAYSNAGVRACYAVTVNEQ